VFHKIPVIPIVFSSNYSRIAPAKEVDRRPRKTGTTSIYCISGDDSQLGLLECGNQFVPEIYFVLLNIASRIRNDSDDCTFLHVVHRDEATDALNTVPHPEFRHGVRDGTPLPRFAESPITPANPICRDMIRDVNGTFNGVRLRRVISVGKTSDGRIARHTIRVLGAPLPELEQQLKLNEPGLLITGSQEIEGRIVDYHADLTGYDITIESKDSGQNPPSSQTC